MKQYSRSSSTLGRMISDSLERPPSDKVFERWVIGGGAILTAVLFTLFAPKAGNLPWVNVLAGLLLVGLFGAILFWLICGMILSMRDDVRAWRARTAHS